MKNLSITTKIGVNGNVPVACEFRIHDGRLFWHGCPKKFSQPQYDNFIWPRNAMLRKESELSIDNITNAVSEYLHSGSFGDIKKIDFRVFDEPQFINEKPSKLAKFGFGPMAGKITEPAMTPDPTPTQTEPATSPTEPASEPITPDPVSIPAPQPPSQQAAIDAFAVLTPLFAGVQANVQAAVMAQLQPVIEKLKVAANNQTRTVQVLTPQGQTNKVSGAVCRDFDEMIQTLTEGDYLYLYGPAGCGKSYTAMQLAEAMGVPFYGMQQVLYEHQITGFVDANGVRHETPFSEAFQNGGLLLWDEADSSSEEAAIVANNALANGVLNLPGVGNVKMNDKFYLVAAGNTGMTGATIEYTARRVMDASTIDRFFFVSMDYDERIELASANGDQSIVDFAHDVRQAVEGAGLYALFSYRAIKRLGNTNLQAAWGDARLLKASFAKGLGSDELRIIHERLNNRNNRWAKALAELF